MFNIKNLLLFSLVALSAAQPILEDRQARVKELHCNGTRWTNDQINRALRQVRKLKNAKLTYPKKFFNGSGKGSAVFNAQGQLWEFPLTDPVWTEGVDAGIFRAIVKDNYGFVGVTNKDPGTGGTVHKC